MAIYTTIKGECQMRKLLLFTVLILGGLLLVACDPPEEEWDGSWNVGLELDEGDPATMEQFCAGFIDDLASVEAASNPNDDPRCFVNSNDKLRQGNAPQTPWAEACFNDVDWPTTCEGQNFTYTWEFDAGNNELERRATLSMNESSFGGCLYQGGSPENCTLIVVDQWGGYEWEVNNANGDFAQGDGCLAQISGNPGGWRCINQGVEGNTYN